MAPDSEQNTSSPSTTTRWKFAKIEMRSAPPKGQRGAAAPSALSRSSWREPITIAVSYRGGAEAWWELRARGRVWRRPGSLALHDVLVEIFDGTGGRPPD